MEPDYEEQGAEAAQNTGERPRFPAPASVSFEAQSSLNTSLPGRLQYPDMSDSEGWLKHISEMDVMLTALMEGLSSGSSATSHADVIAGVPVYRSNPVDKLVQGNRVYLDVHGGALIYLGGAGIAPWCKVTAAKVGMAVVAADYRMPPKHPYPAGLDDCVAVYRALVEMHGAENIIVGGTSAGGNLASALVLRARDEGVPLPAGLVLLSPQVDLTETGDSFQTLLGIDRLWPLMPVNRLYAAGSPLDDPYLSPLYADFTSGFPPTFLQSGTRDLFLSNTVRMHRALRKADIPAELHVWEAMPHGAFMGAPEDNEIDDEIRKFINGIWPAD